MQIHPKLRELRGKYRIKIAHLRRDKKSHVLGGVYEFTDKNNISPVGGVTVVDVLDKSTNKPIACFRAECSNNEVFNKRVGLNIALGRAYKEFARNNYTFVEKK